MRETHKKHSLVSMKKAASLLIVLGLLTACGIKPSSVEPPDADKGTAFPRTYPDISTDPLPGGSANLPE